MAVGRTNGKRAAKARATRVRMLAAAHELFVEHGYGATALQDIADAAGVAVQTIYFTFGNKRTLLKEVVDVAIAGDDEPVATMDREWFTSSTAAATAAEQLAIHVAATAPILARTAPVIKVVDTAAATDPEVAALWPDEADPRYTVLLAAARKLVSKPDAVPGMRARQVADILYGVLSPQLYLVFVEGRGWSPAKWSRWVLSTLTAQLCTTGP